MDTHTDIVRYARKLSEEIERAAEPDTLMEMDDEPLDLVDWLNEKLSLEIWTKKAPEMMSKPMDGFDTIESWKAEILITCGGPTVKIELDSRWSHADLFHSWGQRGETNTATGTQWNEETRWELSTKASSLLIDLIGELAE
jgi:hypothetical protein